jgi:hypothetical protein
LFWNKIGLKNKAFPLVIIGSNFRWVGLDFFGLLKFKIRLEAFKSWALETGLKICKSTKINFPASRGWGYRYLAKSPTQPLGSIFSEDFFWGGGVKNRTSRVMGSALKWLSVPICASPGDDLTDDLVSHLPSKLFFVFLLKRG